MHKESGKLRPFQYILNCQGIWGGCIDSYTLYLLLVLLLAWHQPWRKNWLQTIKDIHIYSLFFCWEGFYFNSSLGVLPSLQKELTSGWYQHLWLTFYIIYLLCTQGTWISKLFFGINRVSTRFQCWLEILSSSSSACSTLQTNLIWVDSILLYPPQKANSFKEPYVRRADFWHIWNSLNII